MQAFGKTKAIHQKMSNKKAFRVGEARVCVLNLGDFLFRLKDEDNVPEEQWRDSYSEVFDKAQPYPSQCFLITMPNSTVLVDAGDYAKFASLAPDNLIPDYQPPPGLVEQLGEYSISR